MSHRKPEKEITKRPSLGMRLAEGLRLFMKQQVRYVLMFSGVAFMLQVFVTNFPDSLFFAVFGAFLMGLSMPGRLWK